MSCHVNKSSVVNWGHSIQSVPLAVWQLYQKKIVILNTKNKQRKKKVRGLKDTSVIKALRRLHISGKEERQSQHLIKQSCDMLHYISFKCFTKLQNSQTQHQRKICQKIKADNLHLKKKRTSILLNWSAAIWESKSAVGVSPVCARQGRHSWTPPVSWLK